MAFTGVTAFPYEMTPLTNTAPFTYRDGTTYLEVLNKIVEWLNDVLVLESNNAIANAIAEFQEGIANAEARVVESELAHNALVANALASVSESVTELTTYVNSQTADAKQYVEDQIYRINEFQHTTVANALGIVRPEEFGALGDWVSTSQTQGTGTDDTAAFQAAVDHILENGGGTLWLSRRYLVNGVVYINQTDYQLTKPFTIQGPGGQGFRANGAAIMRTTPGDIFAVNLAPVGEKVIFKSLTGNVATLTTNVAHNLTVGKIVIITGVDNTFNGAYTVTTVPTPTSFTFAKVSANVAGVPVTTANAHAKISTLPPDETTAGFRAEGFSIIGRRIDPAVVVTGINAFNMWRVRSSVANIYTGYLDYVVYQANAGTFGATDNYCDQSMYENIWIQFSTFGGLKLILPDASKVEGLFFETPMGTVQKALEVRAGQGFSIDGFLAWHPNTPGAIPVAGSSLIDLQTCRAVRIGTVHIERSQYFESAIRARNVEGLEVDSISTYWHMGDTFRFETVKMAQIHNWYSNETKIVGTSDLNIADTQCSDIDYWHTAFYDNAAGNAKRSMIINKPAGPIPVTIDGIGTRGSYLRTAYKYLNASAELNNTQQAIIADAANAQIIIDLPLSNGNEGKQFSITKIDSTTNLVTVRPNGAESIRDLRGLWAYASPYNLALQGYSITLLAGSGVWYILSQVPTQALKSVFAWNPGALASGASTMSPEMTASNFALGDPLALGNSLDLLGCSATAYVSSTGKVRVTLTNLTGASVNVGNVTWTVKNLKWP